MKIDKQRKMYYNCLESTGFKKDPTNKKFPPNWDCFSLKKEKGKGNYWVYFYKDLFALSVLDFQLNENYFINEVQEKYISLNYFESIKAKELSKNKFLKSNSLIGHIGKGSFKGIYYKDIPIKTISLSIMPKYYEDILKEKFPFQYENPLKAFESVDDNSNFLEIIMILKQIKNFKYSGVYSDLFYESKVIEIISLIVKKTKEDQYLNTSFFISTQDKNNIQYIASYIEKHYMEKLRIEDLITLSNMGKTKLKYTFKQIYKCTIHQYLTNIRLLNAKYLLKNTDYPIAEISKTIGYKKTSNFSSNFKKNTGLLPKDYRKSMNNN